MFGIGTTLNISSRSPKSGSTLAAAQALRVSQTTAARRIAALEAATGAADERRQAGYALTPTGEWADAGEGACGPRLCDCSAKPWAPSRATRAGLSA